MAGLLSAGRIAPDIMELIAAEESQIGRNDPCPCGSGSKFKKCCGAVR
jgi:uncharacterized protein YecA (UPF0149 family)